MNAEITALFAPARARVEAIASKAHAAMADLRAMQQEREDEYRAALSRFDWQFEFSEERHVRQAGRVALAKLLDMQQDVDPDGSIWLSCPGAQGHGAPRPYIAKVAA